MRKPIIAGNWKMNKTNQTAKQFCLQLTQTINATSTDIIIAPPFTALQLTSDLIKNTPINLAAQTLSEHNEGAYTGDIAATMLTDLQCNYVIIGHSERRQYHNETNAVCEKKCQTALNHKLIPIYCVGETLQDRENNQTLTVIKTQLKETIANLTIDASNFVIAYEPVWAIGTGKVATPQQAQDVHQFIRETLTELKGASVANSIRILYGGSVKPNNIDQLIQQPDIDGGLIGGACLDLESFGNIITSVENHYNNT